MISLSTLLSDVLGGHRLTEPEATFLLNTQDRQVLRIASAAEIPLYDPTKGESTRTRVYGSF